MRLSQGLDLRVVATSGRTVEYAGGGGGGGGGGGRSSEPFHQRPDYGATFPAPGTSGGWAYVSNSEIPDGGGGVGVLTFDGGGEVTGYGRLLRGTDRNCGGGATGWGTFLSCEEAGGGHCHQLGPFGGEVHRNASRTSLGGSRGGHFESVASDERGTELGHPPTFYVTEDATRGALRRFRPSVADWEDPATMLHGDGTFEYLVLQPTDGRGRFGRARWTDDEDEARDSAWRYYQYSEGIEIVGGTMYFTSRRGRDLFIVDIDAGTYEREHLPSTDLAFSPDQIVRLGGDGDMLYLTNHGWVRGAAGVYGRESRTGRYVPILESTVYDRLTTGLAFSPDGRHMYICFQKAGILFDVWRRDGRKFGGKPMNLKYRA